MTTTGAEIDMSDQDGYDATEVDEGKWGAMRMIGLLALLAAFAGFVYLAYMQGVRNGAVGAPPVITAEKAPYKVLPDNPGGETFADQEKMIFDRVEGSTPSVAAANREPAATAAAQSPLAGPVASADDTVTHESAPLVVAEAAPARSSISDATITAPLTPPSVTADPIASAPVKLSEAGAAGDGIAVAIAEAEEATETESGVVKGYSPAGTTAATTTVTVTETPPSKAPVETVVASAPPSTAEPPSASATAESGSTPAGSAEVAAGAYMVQIASYRDKPQAEEAWKKFSSKFSDLAASVGPNYQTADVPGKGEYVRLRVGPFDNKTDANTLCEELKSRSQGCLVIKT